MSETEAGAPLGHHPLQLLLQQPLQTSLHWRVLPHFPPFLELPGCVFSPPPPGLTWVML